MRTCVVMTMYRRPEYTARVLNSLARCYGIDNRDVFLFVDFGCPEVAQLANEFAVGKRCTVHHNERRIGCNHNTWQALAKGFEQHEAVVAVEDDTVFARDALEYFDWALEAYEHDQNVFSISGYRKRIGEELSLACARQVSRHQWFTPWGWATWSDRYADIKRVADSWQEGGPSWDEGITDHARKGRFEIYPELARVQNIGAELGEHVPSPEWHAQNHFNAAWAGMFDSAGGQWRETNA
jgi:hypothetical protein